MKRALLTGLLIGTFTAVIACVASYVIGALILGNSVIGGPYWGAIIYFGWISIFCSVAVPYLLRKVKLYKATPLLNTAIVAGISFFIVSYSLIRMYSLLDPSDFGFLVRYELSLLSIMIPAILVCVTTAFLISRSDE